MCSSFDLTCPVVHEQARQTVTDPKCTPSGQYVDFQQPHMRQQRSRQLAGKRGQVAAQICAAMCGSIRQLSVGTKLELPNRLAYLYPCAWRFACQW